MNLNQRVNIIAIAKKVGGNFNAAVAIVSRAILDMSNNVAFNPDHNVSGIGGSTQKTAAAVITTDIATGQKYAVLVKDGAILLVAESVEA